MFKQLYALLISLFFLSQISFAQGTDASIEGVVQDESKKALVNSTISLRNSATGFVVSAATGTDGRFSFRQLPVGGPYSISVSMVGYSAYVRDSIMLNQGDHIRLTIPLSNQAIELKGVSITNNNFKNRGTRLSKATSITAKEIEKLPSSNRNFTNLAQLSPLVGGGLNVAGMSSKNDAVTIDGVTARESSFGGPDELPYTLSMEALREFEVVTNAYDVTEARNLGGAIKAVTKSGTNQFHGSVFNYFWDNRLAASTDIMGRNVINDTKQQRGFTIGGPIVKNKAHFFFAYDGERLSQAFDLWAKSTTQGVVQNNEGQLASKDSLDKAIRLLQQYYGVSDQRQYGFFTRNNTLDTWFGRIDWQLNQKHKLTLRYNHSDYIRPNNTNSDIGRFGIYDAGYDFIVKGKNALVALRSQINKHVSNDFKAGYYFNTRQNAINTDEHPQLWLTMQSQINGQQYNATLVGRYNRWTPEVQENDIFTVSNDVYWKKGKYDLVLGTQNSFTKTSGIYTHDVKGRFDFNSIRSLELKQPDRYRRKFTNPGQELRDPLATSLAELSVYAQATTELMPNLKASLGLRYDVAIFSKAPDYNQLLFTELGYKNNKAPVDLNNLQPRFNFNWDVKGDGSQLVDGGLGWFSGQMVTRPYIYSLIDNGIRFTGIDITGKDGYVIDPSTGKYLERNGALVPMPVPDYNSYKNNYQSIPGNGYTNAELFGTGNQAQVVRFVDEDLQVPTSLKAHLSYHRYLTSWLRIGVSGYYTQTKNMLVMDNALLKNEVAFRLEGEGGREVYTPLAKMKTAAGDFNAAKKSVQFSEALRFTNGYKTRFWALVLDAAVKLPKEGSLSLSYTRAQAKGAERYRNEDDQRFVGVSYFDDYNFINNGYSPNDFRQKVLVNFSSPKVGGFTFGAYLTMVEAGRFSAIISPVDVMGTNIRELRGYSAYIFDPNDPNTLAYQGAKFVSDLKQVMDQAGPAARKYLKENIGQYAQPNGGLMGWRSQLNARITNEIQIFKGQKLALNFDCFNVLNLINKEWGGYWNYPFEELYKVKSFDKEKRAYQYEVNKNWGQRRKEGAGFVLMFGAKYTF